MNKSKTIIFVILLVLFLSLSWVGCTEAAIGDTKFVNPLKYDTVEQITTSLLDNLQKIVATLAIVFIVIGGLMYIFSAGEEKKIEKAKKIVTGAVIGFVIVLIAPALLREIGTILGWSGTSSTGLTLKEIITNVLKTLLSISGIIAIIFLVIGGITYMGGFSTVIGSGDSKKNVETGKKIITNSIIGIAIIMGALVIVNQISVLFG